MYTFHDSSKIDIKIASVSCPDFETFEKCFIKIIFTSVAAFDLIGNEVISESLGLHEALLQQFPP